MSMESKTYENVYLAFSPDKDVEFLYDNLSKPIIGTLKINFKETHMSFTFRSTNTKEIYHDETTMASSPDEIVVDNEFVLPCEEGNWIFRFVDDRKE